MAIFLSDYITAVRSYLSPRLNAQVSDADLQSCFDCGDEVEEAIEAAKGYYNLTKEAQ